MEENKNNPSTSSKKTLIDVSELTEALKSFGQAINEKVGELKATTNETLVLRDEKTGLSCEITAQIKHFPLIINHAERIKRNLFDQQLKKTPKYLG